MSLLDSSWQYEPITVYPEVLTTDADGNKITRPSETGIPATARFQPAGEYGAPTDTDNRGFEARQTYKMRLPRWDATPIGAQAQIEWQGVRWAVFGDAVRHHGSAQTARLTYMVRRF